MPILCLLLIVATTAAGDFFLKRASGQSQAVVSVDFALGSLLYMASALGFVYAMRHMSMASIGVWYAVLTVLFMTALGVFAFDERLSWNEVAGIGMAISAIVLMSQHA